MTTTTDSPAGNGPAGSKGSELHPKEQERRAAVAAFPYAAVTVQTTGIHPATGRMVSIDIVTCTASGETGEVFHAVFDPNCDPGPKHQHGLSREEISDGQRFSAVLKTLDRLLDDRVVLVHDAPYTWGFIVSEARRAMTAAARHNRSRSRGRGRGRRRRQKVGHVPAPERIIDTLASARRHAVKLDDTRLGSVARHCGVLVPSPVATRERTGVPESQTSREDSETLIKLWLCQRDKGADTLAQRSPDELRADRFGLQRSAVRVDAAEAPRIHTNPGRYEPGKELRRGMEFVVAPEISMDPNDVIEPAVRAELNYCEKLSRETSVVVCNQTTELTGKAMHAQRKGIPLLSDAAFIAALERIKEALPSDEDDPATSRTAPRAPHRRSSRAQPSGNQAAGNKPASDLDSKEDNGGPGNRPNHRRGKRNRRRRGKNRGRPQAQKGTQPQGDNEGNGKKDSRGDDNAPHSPKPKRRRRRRGGRRNRGGKGQHHNRGTQHGE